MNKLSPHAKAFVIQHLFEVPQQRERVAAMIHREFWTDVPGASAQGMAQRLAQAKDAQQVPLCLVAMAGDEAVGVVNLVDNDADDQPQWHPWLAGLVVHAAWRGRGVGSALGRALCTEAQRLGFARLYFGTDAPGFYARLGAVEQLRLRRDFCYMRLELPLPPTA